MSQPNPQTQPWSRALVRSSFSEWLVDDAIREANGAIAPEVEALLRATAEKKSQVSELRKVLTSVKRLISKDTFEALEEELAAIQEDFTWAKSKRGKYVAEIQDWVQTFHAALRAEEKFADLYVGGHEPREVVYVVGKADSDAVLNELIEFLHEKKPPRKIMTKVAITGGDKRTIYDDQAAAVMHSKTRSQFQPNIKPEGESTLSTVVGIVLTLGCAHFARSISSIS